MVISLIVPTRNRARTLARVAASYFEQEPVDEIIFVDDAGSDDTRAKIDSIAARYPEKRLKFLRNSQKLGASQSRNLGVRSASNDLILFCDDDELLERHYASTCLDKLRTTGASAVSGRRVYMRPGETPLAAIARFGEGMRRARPFRYGICEYVNGARFKGDIELPFTNAVILTYRHLLQAHPFDAFYAKGNGYREETDYQMQIFVEGHRIVVTNDCHSVHLPLGEVRDGGQRVSRWTRVYWSIFYTDYFFRKFHAAYAKRVGLRTPRFVSLASFTAFVVYREFVRPPLYAVAMAVLSRRRSAPLRVESEAG